MAIDLSPLRDLAGFMGACLVDGESGLMLAAETGDGTFDLEAAGAANTEVLRAQSAVIDMLGTKDSIEDILVTLDDHTFLIRPLEDNPFVFILIALKNEASSLGMARIKLKSVEGSLKI